MKKRILSMLLVLVMLLTILPVSALAKGGGNGGGPGGDGGGPGNGGGTAGKPSDNSEIYWKQFYGINKNGTLVSSGSDPAPTVVRCGTRTTQAISEQSKQMVLRLCRLPDIT